MRWSEEHMSDFHCQPLCQYGVPLPMKWSVRWRKKMEMLPRVYHGVGDGAVVNSDGMVISLSVGMLLSKVIIYCILLAWSTIIHLCYWSIVSLLSIQFNTFPLYSPNMFLRIIRYCTSLLLLLLYTTSHCVLMDRYMSSDTSPGGRVTAAGRCIEWMHQRCMIRWVVQRSRWSDWWTACRLIWHMDGCMSVYGAVGGGMRQRVRQRHRSIYTHTRHWVEKRIHTITCNKHTAMHSYRDTYIWHIWYDL